MMQLYRDHGSRAKFNAQRNLIGRTHYVDDDTLRFHKSKIIRARAHCDGLLFSIVTSDAVDYQNTKRGFRFVIFDLFGTVLARTPLDDAFRRSEQASKAMYHELDTIDAVAVTQKAIFVARVQDAQNLDRLADQVAAIAKAAAS